MNWRRRKKKKGHECTWFVLVTHGMKASYCEGWVLRCSTWKRKYYVYVNTDWNSPKQPNFIFVHQDLNLCFLVVVLLLICIYIYIFWYKSFGSKSLKKKKKKKKKKPQSSFWPNFLIRLVLAEIYQNGLNKKEPCE